MRKTTPPIQVDIVSDIVCPWCWLGTRYFFKAVQNSPYDVEVTWRPYMLDPTLPPEGRPYGDYMKAKFGDAPDNRFKAMRDHLEAAAPDAGITFRFGDIPMRPNTLNAHRLMKWAQGQDVGDQAAEALFKAFFDELKDVGDKGVLVQIAENIGLDGTIVGDLLDSAQDTQAVTEEIQFFRNLGVSGVPTFIHNGRYAIQGAQEPETHLQALEKTATLPPPS